MNTLVNFNSQLTMSSREIAALLESRHRDVCVSISRLMDSGAISGYAATPYTKNVWRIYEQRKADLQKQGLSNKEYQDAIKRLADELGI